jgi:hypothetical protein
MKKKHFRFLSLAFFLVGIFFLLNSKIDITGAVVGVSNISSGISSILGLVFIIGGLSLLMIQGSASIDDLVEDIHEVIDEQKEKYKANPRFVKGLKEIERSVGDDKDSYYRISSYGKNESHLRKAILKRLERRKEGLKRREEYFFQIPHHAKHDPKTHETTVIDLPDKGLYEYAPMGGRKSKFVELEVTHYTPNDSYKGIKRDFEHEKDDVMFEDANGWAYFVSKPLPERLTMKTVRRVLGTGNQTYAGKTSDRNPEYEVKFKIRVPKERVLVKEETYHVPGGEDLDVKKYAIAGGISRRDIIGMPEGKRYADKNLSEYHASKKNDKWRKSA